MCIGYNLSPAFIMSAYDDERIYPGSPEDDPEERMKRIAAAEAITLLSSRAFRSHICAVPVYSYPQSKSRTVKKKQVNTDYAIPLTVNNVDCDMPTVVDEVSQKPTSPKMITYQPRVEEDTEITKPSQPLPGCDLVIVENSIPIHLMSREELASKRPVKTTSPRHLPPKKRRLHISPPRSTASEVPTKKPVPPKTLALAPVSPVMLKAPLDLSPAVTPDFNTDMAVEYVESQLNLQLSAIDRRAREVRKNRPGSLTSPLASPTAPPSLAKGQLLNVPSRNNSFSTLLKRSQSLTMPVSPRMAADGKQKAAEDIVPGSAQAKALTETLRARMMKKDEDGDIALHIAVVHGNVPLVRVLVTLMKNDNHSLDTTNNIKQTALHLSILTEDMTIVRMLLEGGSNPNLGDRHGDNCFHLAVRRQNLEVMRVLVEETRVTPELATWNNEGFTPLHIASQKRFTPCMSYLVSKGANVNAKDGKSGRTSLFHAVEKGDHDTCKHLIKLGASPEISNYAGFTPFAATPKSSPICVLLSSYFPGKKATARPDQIQGQEFPELKIKQIATQNEVIYKLNGSSTSSDDRKCEVKLIAEGHEGVRTPPPNASSSSSTIVRREIMYPDSFKRVSKPKKFSRPSFKRSDSMPAHLTHYSRVEDRKPIVDKSPCPRSPRSYSPVSDASDNSNDAKEPIPVSRIQERFDSPSGIIERARMQKRAFPQPLSLEIPTSSSDERFLPMHLQHHGMMTSEATYQPMVQVMTSLEGRLVPTMVPAYAFQHYDMSMAPRPMMYRVPMPHMQIPMYRTMRSPTYAKYRRVKDEPKDLSSPSSAADSMKSERDFDTVAKMSSPIKRPISPDDKRRVLFVKTESATTSEVETEPDEMKTGDTSDSIVTTTAGEPVPLPDSSCPDLPTFGDRSPTPGEKSPSPSRAYVPFPRPVHSSGETNDNVKIDKKDLMLKIRSKVEARSSPKSPSEKQHSTLARSSSMGSLPVARLAPEELPSVLQDVK